MNFIRNIWKRIFPPVDDFKFSGEIEKAEGPLIMDDLWDNYPTGSSEEDMEPKHSYFVERYKDRKGS